MNVGTEEKDWLYSIRVEDEARGIRGVEKGDISS
jgi:hypothetical protein